MRRMLPCDAKGVESVEVMVTTSIIVASVDSVVNVKETASVAVGVSSVADCAVNVNVRSSVTVLAMDCAIDVNVNSSVTLGISSFVDVSVVDVDVSSSVTLAVSIVDSVVDIKVTTSVTVVVSIDESVSVRSWVPVASSADVAVDVTSLLFGALTVGIDAHTPDVHSCPSVH